MGPAACFRLLRGMGTACAGQELPHAHAHRDRTLSLTSPPNLSDSVIGERWLRMPPITLWGLEGKKTRVAEAL
jgi:hypothetical protein